MAARAQVSSVLLSAVSLCTQKANSQFANVLLNFVRIINSRTKMFKGFVYAFFRPEKCQFN